MEEKLCLYLTLQYLQHYPLITIPGSTYSPAHHISSISSSLLRTTHPTPSYRTPTADFCFVLTEAPLRMLGLTHKNTRLHNTNTAWPWPSERPVHIHNSFQGLGGHNRGALGGWWGACVCEPLFVVCDYVCCHPAAVCMFYTDVCWVSFCPVLQWCHDAFELTYGVQQTSLVTFKMDFISLKVKENCPYENSIFFNTTLCYAVYSKQIGSNNVQVSSIMFSVYPWSQNLDINVSLS